MVVSMNVYMYYIQESIRVIHTTILYYATHYELAPDMIHTHSVCIQYTLCIIFPRFLVLQVVELKPNGSNTKVTSDNCIEYIHALANYHLNKRIDRQFRSFREGLNTVIPIEWLTLFNQFELQVLISGVEEPINMDELMGYTMYSGTV